MGRRYETVDCELCDGTGQVPIQFSMMLDGFCAFCGGTGAVKKYYDVIECKECGGQGWKGFDEEGCAKTCFWCGGDGKIRVYQTGEIGSVTAEDME